MNDRCAPPRRSASVTRPLTSAPRARSSASSRSSTGGLASSCSTRADPVGQQRAELVTDRRQPVELVGVAWLDQGAGRGDQRAEASGGDFHAEARRHDLFELVGLVEDDHVVLGQHHAAAGQMRPVEMRIDHHDVGHRSPLPGASAKQRPPDGQLYGPDTPGGRH